MAAGGLVHVALWPIFTRLHGPTSFNENRELLGGEAQLWGALMEGPSALLVAAGLAGAYSLLVADAGRAGRIGFWLAMAGLVIPAAFTLAIRETVPPLLTPLLGLGLILIAYGSRVSASFQRLLLVALGATQLFAFLWSLVVRPDLMDRIDGYRIYGVVANVLFGLGWIALGASLATVARRA